MISCCCAGRLRPLCAFEPATGGRQLETQDCCTSRGTLPHLLCIPANGTGLTLQLRHLARGFIPRRRAYTGRVDKEVRVIWPFALDRALVVTPA